ncbi:hypothetical protein LC613_01435 [Nostoc sphaeroides CHAB 2801]|uniref:hypothetical protein n=1 Tax=Nostoc sphaeroides TaxID=446679 RepID=UPI0015F2F0EB|nr:hypothetical protein [Nostoc sphaeroides]MCC5626923.1 hypothetical protein [Nostoc sphaeroides CHAB 2801]
MNDSYKTMRSLLSIPITDLRQYSSVKPKNLGKDAKFRVSTGLKLVPKILN